MQSISRLSNRKTNFIRISATRVRKINTTAILIQALGLRPYHLERENCYEIERKLEAQVRLLEEAFDPQKETPKNEDIATTFVFEHASGLEATTERLQLQVERHLKILPTNEVNARTLSLATKRLSTFQLEISKLIKLSAKNNYEFTRKQAQALVDYVNNILIATLSAIDSEYYQNRFFATSESLSYRFYSQNLNAKSGFNSVSPADEIIPDWALDKEIDLLALNETLPNREFDILRKQLTGAGYNVLTDPRDTKTYANTCALAFSPKLLSGRAKPKIFVPKEASGLDYIATLIPLLDGRKLGVASIRLHSFLTNDQIQDHRLKGDLMRANYQSIGDSLPLLQRLIKQLQSEGAEEVLVMGDHNNARIVPNGDYSGLAQEPASLQRQSQVLSEVGMIMYTPKIGGSYTYIGPSGRATLTAIDHVSATRGIKLSELAYDPKHEGSKLDHAGLTGLFTIPFIH